MKYKLKFSTDETFHVSREEMCEFLYSAPELKSLRQEYSKSFPSRKFVFSRGFEGVHGYTFSNFLYEFSGLTIICNNTHEYFCGFWTINPKNRTIRATNAPKSKRLWAEDVFKFETKSSYITRIL